MIKPNKLNKGDKIAVVSLSSGILGEDVFIHKYYIAKERLENDFGFKPRTNLRDGLRRFVLWYKLFYR